MDKLTKTQILENEMFIMLCDRMLDIYGSQYSVEDIIYAWEIGVDKIKEILEERKNEEKS